MSKLRKWWIDGVSVIYREPPNSFVRADMHDCIMVVEYSALEMANQEIERLRAALKTYAKHCPAISLFHSNGSMYPSRREALEALGDGQ